MAPLPPPFTILLPEVLPEDGPYGEKVVEGVKQKNQTFPITKKTINVQLSGNAHIANRGAASIKKRKERKRKKKKEKERKRKKKNNVNLRTN